MKKTFLIILFVQISIASSIAQMSKSEILDRSKVESITADELKAHLTILASDEYEGRETGTVGNRMAAEYIAAELESIGIPKIPLLDSYFQKVAFSWTQWEDISIKKGEKVYRQLWDFVSFPKSNENLGTYNVDEVVFLGYGIDDENYSDYKRAKVKDKVILIYKGEPIDEEGVSQVTGSQEVSKWSLNIDLKLKAAKKHGVKCVLIIEDNLKQLVQENRRFLLGPSISLGDNRDKKLDVANAFYISTTMATDIIGDKFEKVVKSRDRSIKKGKSKDVCLKPSLEINQHLSNKVIEGDNVLGFISGTDLSKKDEIVIITAHYDHIGKRGDDVYNGADDNGTGTTALLEMAEAMMMAKVEGTGPRRSVLFMWVTGEEKGLLGSRYYVENPIFPLENTVCNINVDMIGRTDEKHEDNPEYIYVIGADRLSSELHEINEFVNKQFTNLELDYTYNDENDPNRYYYRSDHYNFAEKGIPAVFYFSGTHEDYHRTSDTVEKIQFEKMTKVSRLIYLTSWNLANREKRIIADKLSGS